MLREILLVALLVPASAVADAGEGEPACEQDAALTRAAAELALSGEAPDAHALAAALREAGSDLVGVRARLSPGYDFAAFLARRAELSDAPLVCGQASSERGQLLLVAARAGSLEPLHVGSTHVRGDLQDGFRDAQLVVADAQGMLERMSVSRAQLRAGIPIADELPRPARVQLVASGRAGPRPVAERVLPAAGRGGPATHAGDATGATAHDSTEPMGEMAVADMLADLRAGAGLQPLREHRLLQRVADVHARRVCESGRVAHTLSEGQDPEQRLRSAGVRARRVGETVSRARTAAAAFAAFDRSPSHRMTLLERGFTDVGIGEHRSDGHTCLVVLLAAWPRFVGGAGPL